MKLIFDGNFLYHKTFSVWSSYYREAVSNGEITLSKILDDRENQQVLIRKCIIDLCATVQRFSDVESVTVVIDSMSWRYSMYDNYKHALTKIKPEYYEQFLLVLDNLESLFRKRGLIVSRINGAEGDDLMYFWSGFYDLNKDKTVIISADADIRQLITENVSVFNNNSKNLAMYCHSGNVQFWEDYWDNSIVVKEINPLKVTISKAILGDSGDNIHNIKRGFGEKSFDKFYATLSEKDLKHLMKKGLVVFSVFLYRKFSSFVNDSNEEDYEKLLFNLRMTWLNIHVYFDVFEDEDFVNQLLCEVDEKKDSYSYNKSFTLENFYGMLLK